MRKINRKAWAWLFTHVYSSFNTRCESALMWTPQNLPNAKSTLVQVMLVAIRQQAIARANICPNLWRDIVSIGQKFNLIHSSCLNVFHFTVYLHVSPYSLRLHIGQGDSTKSSSTFSATNISSNIVLLLQLHDTIQMESIFCYQIQ